MELCGITGLKNHSQLFLFSLEGRGQTLLEERKGAKVVCMKYTF